MVSDRAAPIVISYNLPSMREKETTELCAYTLYVLLSRIAPRESLNSELRPVSTILLLRKDSKIVLGICLSFS